MITEEKAKVLDLFRQGRNLYKQMKFAEAYKYFVEALKVDPDDHPSKIYVKRCRLYAKNPPPPDWDGVEIYTTK